MFTKQDLQDLEVRGLNENAVKEQLNTFNNGVPFAKIVTAASIGNGIEVLDENAQKESVAYYEKNKAGLDIIKFVPASGAATRMFKFLHEFLSDYNEEEEVLRDYIKVNKLDQLKLFFDNLKDFAFILELRKAIRKKYPDYKQSNRGQRMKMLVKTMLSKKGLNFSNLPKGLIPFHRYTKFVKTAYEEQLFEATQYAFAHDTAHLHFTFSPEHLEFFKNEYERVQNRITSKTKIKLKISYSFQCDSTKTIAVDNENIPVRKDDGNLLLRPSGHGALIKNLNNVNADIVFIKNIDNVAAEEYLREIAFYKKMLAGKLLQLQKKIFSYLQIIIEHNVTDENLAEMKAFLWNELYIRENPETPAGIAGVLNRPLRVCGVVKNTGAPGGGPFWVRNKEGNMSLQIVEMSQVNIDDTSQASLAKEATHFNPVDIVCATKDYEGNCFNLAHFVDESASFISNKTLNGKPIKALELPGLWNGAMARWNTVFVEVPQSTFNPVKTVNDLLRNEHRPNA
ncbi:hypothetical protein ULMS_01140 [Patiriisocius marinistellae]|uniref:DUF4301 domain-containing protein n=1 Tax=Patiriisocius marinistellae TaxID=2494560 RepID=A0A5J4FWX1_9FLAO|nr:DUF4301 family protein [Patiriisocius marinistellae]GEQ84606.1 hypothetical protein ULMS_01140 [Patiriisocius marinistellae]